MSDHKNIRCKPDPPDQASLPPSVLSHVTSSRNSLTHNDAATERRSPKTRRHRHDDDSVGTASLGIQANRPPRSEERQRQETRPPERPGAFRVGGQATEGEESIPPTMSTSGSLPPVAAELVGDDSDELIQMLRDQRQLLHDNQEIRLMLREVVQRVQNATVAEVLSPDDEEQPTSSREDQTAEREHKRDSRRHLASATIRATQVIMHIVSTIVVNFRIIVSLSACGLTYLSTFGCWFASSSQRISWEVLYGYDNLKRGSQFGLWTRPDPGAPHCILWQSAKDDNVLFENSYFKTARAFSLITCILSFPGIFLSCYSTTRGGVRFNIAIATYFLLLSTFQGLALIAFKGCPGCTAEAGAVMGIVAACLYFLMASFHAWLSLATRRFTGGADEQDDTTDKVENQEEFGDNALSAEELPEQSPANVDYRFGRNGG